MEKLARALLESLPDAMVLVRADGAIDMVNREAERLFGYAREELLGRPLDLLVPERFRGTHAGHCATFRAEGKSRAMGAGLELYARHKDGREFPVEISLSTLATGSGVVVSSVIRDITDRKTFEQLICRQNAQLEQANQELDAFCYMASHDLRAPLRAIHGFARVLETGLPESVDDDGRHCVERIQQNALQMSTLIEDLLQFSRSARAPLALQRVAVANLMGACVAEFGEEIAARKALVTLGPLPTVHGDPSLLTQVFRNLLGNALKYTRPRARPEIQIGMRADGAIHVRDNGVGFENRFADRIFSAFQRLHSSAEFEGTGVGLAIVQRIVERHGGRVWAEGEPGRGATFWMRLPEAEPVPV